MSGQISEWFFNNLAGISPDESGAGFRKFIIKPAVVSGLRWVKGSFNSISGNIISEWKKETGRLQMKVVVPLNTIATIHVPAKKGNVVFESGKPVITSKVVKVTGFQNGYYIFEVGSGEYHFSSIQ